MRRREQPALPASLERARTQFETWRRTRDKRSQIPEGLLQSAAALAREFGVHPVSKALRVNYDRLKKAVRAARAAPSPEKASRSVFVELDRGQAVSSPECVIEMEDPRGAKMRVQLRGQGALDLVALGNAFWSQRE